MLVGLYLLDLNFCLLMGFKLPTGNFTEDVHSDFQSVAALNFFLKNLLPVLGVILRTHCWVMNAMNQASNLNAIASLA